MDNKKKWLLAAGLGLIIPVFVLVGCQPSPTAIDTVYLDTQQTGISVSGEGKMMAVPDLATLQIGVESQQDTVEAARDEAAQAMSDVIAALKAQGIADKDIQTQYFNISQVTRWDDYKNEQVVTGYRVTNTVSTKIRDIETVGTVIDAVTGVGGDLTRISGVNFSIEDPSPYVADIREQAIADARGKAEQLAELTGVNLGPPIYISESSNLATPVYTRSDYAMESAAMGVPTSISPGELELNLYVQITYAIVN